MFSITYWLAIDVSYYQQVSEMWSSAHSLIRYEHPIAVTVECICSCLMASYRV